MAERKSIKIVDGALQETSQKEIILRGVVDPSSLQELNVAPYQREILSPAKVSALMGAISTNGVPDILLGMRGERFLDRDGSFYLQDEVFIVDGLQRVTAALQLIAAEEMDAPYLGATIHFDTTEESERELFERVNLGQTKLSSNVTLRNQATKNPAVDALLRLTNDKSFVLCGQVSWKQNMNRGDLITATTYAKAIGMLHSHAGPGRGSSVIDLSTGLEKIMENLTRTALVANVRAFFDVIDRAWGIKRVAYRTGAPYIKTGFLVELARVFSDHTNFWKDDRLTVDSPTIKKLAGFPINDPEVMRLASAGGTAGELLYNLFVRHIDAGRRTNRLQQRRSLRDKPSAYGADSDDLEGGEDQD